MKILLLILLPIFSFSQTTYHGTILNKQTKQKIPFATVGLQKESTGINAEENGEFNLVSKLAYPNDTLNISCVGYETLKVPVSELSTVIELQEKTTVLTPVVVKTKWQYEKLNYGFDHSNLSITTFGSHTQVAKHFFSPSDYGTLTEVKISGSKTFFQPHSAIFRIRIYDMDSITKGPSADLCDQVIEVKSESRIVKINLEKYKIHVGREFFIALEWLKIPYNEHRFKSTDEKTGINSDYVEYRPVIMGKRPVEQSPLHPAHAWNPNAPHEIWILDYQHKWTWLSVFQNVGIGVEVKY